MSSFRTFALVMALFTPTLVQGKCQKYLDLANTASGNLMDKYWGGEDFGSQAIWISGVQTFYLSTLDQITGANNWGDVINTVFNSNRNYLDTGKSYDDVQWVSIAYGRAGDVANQQKYYDIATEGADSEYCGGGIFWNGNKDYKNAITTELYITTSGYLYETTKDEKYLTAAKDTWAWFKDSGMQGENGLFNDGLTKDGSCANNGQTQWTYNQATLLPGLAWLAKAGDASATESAYAIIDAIMASLTQDGTLKEGCDQGNVCNDDQKSFKGISVYFISWFLQISGTDDGTKYGDFVKAQADAVLANAAVGTDGSYGPIWYTKEDTESIVSSQGSALGAFVGAGWTNC